MQEIILEEPYEFVPPVESERWVWWLRFYLRRFMRTTYGVTEFECRGAERLKESLDAKRGIILASNHSRLADPMSIGYLSGQAGTEVFAMASWHLFKQGWLQRLIIRTLGAFSVYREGNDRQAVSKAIDILFEGRRPLLIFPEGAVSRHNDLLMELMDGPGFIARQAAKRREKEGKAPVVIHPVAIRYSFLGDPKQAVGPDLKRLEEGFSWRAQEHLPLVQRINKVGEALLALKEVEYLGQARSGDAYARAADLIATMLTRLEAKWDPAATKEAPAEGAPAAAIDSDVSREARVVARVKRLRTILLPDLIEKRVCGEEREERWRDLATLYYLQQIAHYPRGYITGDQDLPERLVETVERMLEDYRDASSYHGPVRCTLVVGEAIEVGAARERGGEGDPAMRRCAEDLQRMLDTLVAERRKELFGAKS